MNTYPSVHYCFLVSSELVIPFFVRSVLLKEGIERQDERIAEILRLPLAEFGELVFSDTTTPVAFHDDAEIRGTFQDVDGDVIYDFDGLNAEIDFDGIFCLLPELVPADAELKSVDPEHFDGYVQAKFEDETVWTIPLAFQPKLIGGYRYRDGAEIINEVKNAVKDLGVELPADFPYWRCIGKLEGTTWDD